ncbi:MAG: M12 family metallo-peptidase [Flavobacteriales bacterium]|nr:M12 family metallo-peptidase [Flavobacteriales bacterium]
MKKFFQALFLIVLCANVFAQQKPETLSSASPQWSDVAIEPQRDSRQIVPANYRTVEVSIHELQNFLFSAPHENVVRAPESSYIIQLPKPDGMMANFTLVEAPVMEPALEAQFPEMRSYAGQGIEDRTATLRCDITPKGFHAQILSSSGTWYIDPYSPSDLEIYISYTKEAFYQTCTKTFNELPPVMPDKFDFDKTDEILDIPGKNPKQKKPVQSMGMQKVANGLTLRTYRLALAGTGEYTAFHGGTAALGLAAMVTSMTRINGVYEKDCCLRMNLVANNNLLVYTNAATDPYTNGNGSTMLNENQTNCNAVIGSANYDIGHVFSTGGGGVAFLNSPCSSNKAKGVSGQSAPIGDPFDIDYVCHEMGHQWGGNHTQNNSCNRSSSAAYEPGSASTIMGYAGICPPDLQPHSDDYFHNHSYNEMRTFFTGTGNSCAASSATGNTIPIVDAGVGGFTIPISTPFELTATGSDANGDLITFCWEQYDLGPATAVGDNTLTNPSGNQPIFRSWLPTVNATRVFPRISNLVNNTIVLGEHMPTYDRSLNFRCTVRDNRAGGGAVNDDNITFSVDNIGGPFVVTAPNTAVTWPANSSQTATWSVANTTAAPISCANVDIWLSTDGGFTYPILVLANTPNDGTQIITVPNILTAQARIKVKASGNIFFDISNTNFTISAGGGGFAFDIMLAGINSPTGSYCGDAFTPQITVNNLGSTTITSFTAQYNVDGGANQNYNWVGSMATGGITTVTLPAMTASTGSHTFNVTLLNPNGVADQSTGNNSGASSFSTISNANIVTLTLLTDCWGEEVSWNIEDAGNNILYSQAGNSLGDQTTFTSTFCLANGCYDFNIADSFGDGLDGTASGCAIDGNYTITDASANVLVQMPVSNYGFATTHNFCVPFVPGAVPGCMAVNACNYNSLATVDDGSCAYGPANDVCASAIQLTVNGGAFAATNLGACVNGPNPSCGGTNMQDVWYYFNYTGGNIVLSTTLGTNNDTRLAVYTACGGTQIACDDDSGPGNASLINLNCGTITPGNAYYIQAGGFNAIEGAFTVTVAMTNINGCTNPLASNYNNCATVDNGYCIVPGCTDTAACNYNASATQNNGSCAYPGCLDPVACNYNASAGCAATCNYPVACNNPAACNFTAGSCMNGTCNFPVPCNNPTACNFTAGSCMNGVCNFPVQCNNPAACNFTAGSCMNGICNFPVPCNNPAACNFTAGSCMNGICNFPVACNDAAACNFTAGSCMNGICNYPVVCNDPAACNFTSGACMNGTCNYPVPCNDLAACNYTSGSGMNGICAYPGCTNSSACNYNGSAGCDDGSCTFPGCTNPTACNYDSIAECDDGSCILPGCMDAAACNYDSSATCENGILCENYKCIDPSACNYVAFAACVDMAVCTYPGCTDPSANNFDPAAGCDNGSCIYGSCQGDFDLNGVINTGDILLFMASFGCLSSCDPFDLTGDGVVNTTDLLLFMGLFGMLCP